MSQDSNELVLLGIKTSKVPRVSNNELQCARSLKLSPWWQIATENDNAFPPTITAKSKTS